MKPSGESPDPFGASLKPSLRQASPEDIEWLLQLRLTTMEMHFQRSGQRLSAQEQRDRVMHAFSAISIVRVAGLDIGMMKVVREPDVWHLVQIQLAPRYQGRGLGTILLEDLLDEAAQAGVPVSLQVLKVNPAMRLYERLGFEIVADRGHSYEMRALGRPVPGGSTT